MADDPESVQGPRSRRRRRAVDDAAIETPTAGQVVIPDDTPLPTFVHAAPGHEPAEDATAVAPEIIAPSVLSDGPLTTPPARGVDHGWMPVLEDRSPDPVTCPFLRAVDERDRLTSPIEAPDPANRCAALREPVPQSLRQQELVCLASGHVNCPRYLRGAVVVAETPDPVVRARRSVSPPVLVSLIVLVMAASASAAFVVARGGLELAVAAATASPVPSMTAVAVVPASPVPTGAPTAIPTPVPTPVPTPTATASPTPSPTPSPSPTVRPTAKPTARPTAPPARSDRYALLRACPGTPRCWIYRVRAGDNLYSIANYFGVSLDSIYARNPWTRTQGLRAGQELRLPPPTR